LLRLIPGETAAKYSVIPIARSGNTLTLAMTDPTNVFAMDDIKFRTGLNVEPVVASETSIQEAIAHHYAATNGNGGGKSVDFVNKALQDMDLEGPMTSSRRERRRDRTRPR